MPSSPSCRGQERAASSSPKDRGASTSPTTSAIKTVQGILATLQVRHCTEANILFPSQNIFSIHQIFCQAGQLSLNQLVALQSSAPLLPSPWSLPSLGAVSAVSPDSGASSVQQLYLQQQQHALQQSLHTLLPLHPQLHTTGQTHTLLLQNQVRKLLHGQNI